ncbi:MAG TPA: hypothetical protein VE686_07475, partial [Beijerinckiaceae bacterium]|nr:hypothetical protein [Beijerinckiaceae bacterium]
MKLTKQQETRLSEIGSRLLGVIEEVANYAYAKRTGKSSGHSPRALAGGTNPLVDGSAAQMNLAAINARDRENLVRLEGEPVVARVVVQWKGEEPAREETLYISRAS